MSGLFFLYKNVFKTKAYKIIAVGYRCGGRKKTTLAFNQGCGYSLKNEGSLNEGGAVDSAIKNVYSSYDSATININVNSIFNTAL